MRDGLGRGLAGHAYQQIDPASYSPKMFEDLLAHLMMVKMQVESDPEGLDRALIFRSRLNDIKLPRSRGLAVGQIMRQGITPLEFVAFSVDPGMKPGNRLPGPNAAGIGAYVVPDGIARARGIKGQKKNAHRRDSIER